MQGPHDDSGHGARVEAATFGADSGMVGAAVLALDLLRDGTPAWQG